MTPTNSLTPEQRANITAKLYAKENPWEGSDNVYSAKFRKCQLCEARNVDFEGELCEPCVQRVHRETKTRETDRWLLVIRIVIALMVITFFAGLYWVGSV